MRELFLNNVLILSLDDVEKWATILSSNFNSGCLSCGRPAYQHLDLETKKCNYRPNELSFYIEINKGKDRYTLDHELVMRAIGRIDREDSDTLNLDVSAHWRIKRAYWSMDANMLDHTTASDIVRIGLFGYVPQQF